MVAWCAGASGGEPAPVYNIRLLTDSTPDLTDIESYLRSITSQFPTPQEKAVAIWRWSQRMRKQASNPVEDGLEVMDPILLFNSYGHCNCGIVSGLNNAFWLNLGWKAHYVQLGDHTVCETSWDGGATWHMFDASMSFYCFNDAGQVASVTEIEKNARFYLENFAPECGTNPVKGPNDHQGWRNASDKPVEYQRTLANGWDSFKAPNSISEYNTYAQWGQRFVLNLRPGESYTRFFGHAAGEGTQGFRPLKTGQDPEGQHGHMGLRANGQWHYSPDLRDPRAADFVYDSSGVKWDGARKGFAVTAADPAEPGVVILRVGAANVVTAAKLQLTVSRETERDAVAVEVSRTAGITYAPAWTCETKGVATSAEIDLSQLVAGATEYLVKVRLAGAGAGLEAANLETTTQINRASLPRLVRGPNRVQLTLGPQVETVQFSPSVVAGNHRATVHEERAVDVEKEVGFYKPILRPAENGAPCSATWKIAVPTPITAVDYGASVCVKSAEDRTTLLHSWDGKTFAADYEKRDASAPWDLMINRAVGSVPPGTRTAFLRYEFETKRNAHSYTGPGIQSARIAVQHEPRVKGFTPIEITYCWIEHRAGGDVEQRHTELAFSPAHEFKIHVGGDKDPTMKWVRLNLQGSAPANEKPGTDGNTPVPAPPRALFRWGKNLALGCAYQLTGAQSAKNPDAGHDLTDGIIAPPDDYVSEKYMPTNVIFEKDAAPVATLDLGSAQNIAAVRVHAGQEMGFHLAFPATITVETSLDGTTFTKAGTAEHNQVFEPPADFVPWENDESPKYAALPAGGRLAYAYRVIFPSPQAVRYLRITCTAKSGWGLLLSEIQAFDQVSVDRNPAPPVVLPPLSSAAK
jgi:VCBS repeat-containing protein